MSITQKEAVFQAITDGQTQGFTGNDLKAFAVEQVKSGLMSGEVEYKNDRTDEKACTNYARALYSNWTKKDTRLNGGAKYVPATIRGPQVKDEQLKKLTESLKSIKVNAPGESDLIARVEAAIEARKAELHATKAQSKVQSLDETFAALAELGIEVA